MIRSRSGQVFTENTFTSKVKIKVEDEKLDKIWVLHYLAALTNLPVRGMR
jgi:hypothetical protein